MKRGTNFKMSNTLFRVSFAVLCSRIGTQLTSKHPRGTRHLPYKHILFDYTLHQQKLEQVQSAKYPGITITGNPDWGQHVSESARQLRQWIYRVTDEALIAETAEWPNFFLMNIFFLLLKDFQYFIISCCHCSWMLCHVVAVKSLPH